MKKVNNCTVDNCIPTPSACVEWNGGDIDYLGICNGESINNIVWEIVSKLQDIAGDDLSSFDIDSLAEVCSQRAPNEVSLLSILNLLKDNDVCLKDYIKTVEEKVLDISREQNVSVDLRCFADFDNLGNALSITRDQLDQLVINNLCSHKDRLDNIEGEITVIKNQISSTTYSVEEPVFPLPCLSLPDNSTSEQVKLLADNYCTYKDDYVGDIPSLTSAFTAVPTYPTDVTSSPNYVAVPSTLADHFNNLLLAYKNLLDRVVFMETTCCAATCDDIELGFTALTNEDNTEVIISFTWGAGTKIPVGFIDKGSYGTITDKNGLKQTFNIDIVENFTDSLPTEVVISGLDLSEELDISITANIGTDSLSCQKCISGKVRINACGYCKICVSGSEGSSVVIVYEGPTVAGEEMWTPTTTTTTGATTTTTTEATTTTTTEGV